MQLAGCRPDNEYSINIIRMNGGRLPKRIVFGTFEGAVRRGRGVKKKEWTDCVQSDIRTFGILCMVITYIAEYGSTG